MGKPRQSLAQSLTPSIAQKFIADPDSAVTTQTAGIDQIKLPHSQPRRYFGSEKMTQLIQSVQEHGILEPLLVRPLPSGDYELVAGERRLRAAQSAGLNEVPIVVREFDDQQALQVSLLENLQREDLNPVEETEGILQLLEIALGVETSDVAGLLHQAHNAKQRGQELNHNVIVQLQKVEEVLSVVGRFSADSFRANRLPLLKLPTDILEALRQGKLEYTKARAIARVKDEEQRHALLQETIEQNLSLAQIKERVKAATPAPISEPTLSARLVLVSRRLKGKPLSEDPKKRKRIEKLLQELELLVEE
ncbi:MAG TPA: ParB/RepB/Spo0J family partition protein [Leptolyngbyaceae cyanobacterium]